MRTFQTIYPPQTKISQTEPTFPSAFSKHFSTFRSPNTQYSNPWKVIRKRTRKGCSAFQHLRFGSIQLPKNLNLNSCYLCVIYFFTTLRRRISPRAESATFLFATLVRRRRFVPAWTNLNRGFRALRHMLRSRKTNTSHVATIFCNHLVKLLQKIIASQKDQHVTCCYQENQHIPEKPTLHMLLLSFVIILQSCYKRS